MDKHLDKMKICSHKPNVIAKNVLFFEKGKMVIILVFSSADQTLRIEITPKKPPLAGQTNERRPKGVLCRPNKN